MSRSPLWSAISRTVADGGVAQRPAVVGDGVVLTYGELFLASLALAHRLRDLGVAPGHVVLTQLDNVPAFLVTMLAVARVGAAFAPIDVGATEAESEHVVALTGSGLLVSARDDQRRLPECLDLVVRVDAAGAVTGVTGSELAPPTVARDVGCLQFSSGTTGPPKGILITHDALFHRTRYYVRLLGLTGADRTLCAMPLSHPHGSETLALPTLMAGGTIVLKSPKYAFPLYLLEEIAHRRVTFFSSIPAFYDAAVKLSLPEPPDLSSLRVLACGSAALATSTAREFHGRFGVRIQQIYGLAELHAICMNRDDNTALVDDSVGRPVEGVEWRIRGESDATRDVEGELVVRSRAMFSGYLDDVEATRVKLRDGWLHTGDVVSVDGDGRFRIVGRREDFIKVNGLKVYATEVERAIIGIRWVKECAVLSERDSVGAERIVAHIVLSDAGEHPDVPHTALAKELRDVLSEHKLPKRCVVWPALPKSPMGKVLKSKIVAPS